VDLQGALSVVCGRLARLEDGVYVLAPPGSGRRGLARCLAGRGFKVFVPRGYGVEAAEEYRDVEDLARRLEGAGGLVFMVVGSSWEAVELAASLSGRLRLVYIPALYGELVEEGGKRRLAWVSHDGLCTAYEGRVVGGACEGLAPGLLSLSLEELEAGVEALETLRRSHKNLGEAALRLLLDVAGIVGPFGGVATAVKAVYDFFHAVTRLRYGEVAGLLKFVAAAEKAREYVRRLEFEALVDSVALEWGMETGRFKTLVEALGDPSLVDWLAHGRHVESLSKFGRVYARYNAEELGVTDEYVVETGVQYPLAKKVFVEKAKEVMRLLESNKAAALVGPRGVGKSTLAKYVAYSMLMQEQADYVVVPEGPVNVNEFLTTVASLQRRVLLLFDVHPREVYTPRFLPGAAEGAEKPLEAAAKAVNSLLAAAKLDHVGRLRVLVTASDDELKTLNVKLDTAAVYRVDLGNVEFLAEVVKSHMGERAESCQGVENLARTIKEYHPDGAYTLVAKYAGLWLRERGCETEEVVEAAKKEPKLFFAHYIWHVLLRGNGDLVRGVAVPLLLHAVFGPVPVGVTYVTKAVKNGVWRFLKPEELEGASLESLREDALEPIAKWLTQQHEDLVEETLRDLAGLNGEETRKPYRETLGDLIEALDWTRNEAIKEGGKVLAELGILKEEALKVFHKILAVFGISEKNQELATSLLAFISRRLLAVFKGDEGRRCWRRAALIVGHALAGYPVLPKRGWFPEDVAEVLGDALETCAVDDYLTIDGKIPPLSINIAWFPYYVEASYASDLPQIRRIRKRLSVFAPYADADTIKAAKKIADEVLAMWRRRGKVAPSENFYIWGLATLVAGGKVNKKTADLLLRAASLSVQQVASPGNVLPVLEALRPLGEKAPHRYVVMLAAASELRMPYQETVQYIYNALQHFKKGLLEIGRISPLIETIAAYSNLLIKHLIHIRDRWEEAVADMCSLYGEVKKRTITTTLNSGFSADRLLDAMAKARVLAATLHNDYLASYIQKHCNLGDIVKEAETVKKTLEEIAIAHPDEVRKIAESNVDLAEYVATHCVVDDAGRVFKNLMVWFTHMLIRYRLAHAISERGELDEEKLEEIMEEFQRVAEILRKLGPWENYLASINWALRTRILAAKSWEEFHKTAKDLWRLCKEAEEYFKPTAEYLANVAGILSNYLVYLAAIDDKESVRNLLKEWQRLLNYDPQISVVTRLMLKFLGMDDEVKLEDVTHAFEPALSPRFSIELLTLTGLLQKHEALRMCEQLSKSKNCVDAVMSALGNQKSIERVKLKLKIETKVLETHLFLDEVDVRTLVEVLSPISSRAQLAFMLLAATEGRAVAVRLHGLWGSIMYRVPLLSRLFRDVYENCGDLNSEGCKLALLKLYYYHI